MTISWRALSHFLIPQSDYGEAKTHLEQLQQALTHLDHPHHHHAHHPHHHLGLYHGALPNTSTITTDSVVSCVSSTLPAVAKAISASSSCDGLQSERKKCPTSDLDSGGHGHGHGHGLMEAICAGQKTSPIPPPPPPCCLTLSESSSSPNPIATAALMNASTSGSSSAGGASASLCNGVYIYIYFQMYLISLDKNFEHSIYYKCRLLIKSRQLYPSTRQISHGNLPGTPTIIITTITITISCPTSWSCMPRPLPRRQSGNSDWTLPPRVT